MTDDSTFLKAQAKELVEENERLILQLHSMQEELDYYARQNRSPALSEQTGSKSDTSVATQARGWIDEEVPALLAENQRLQSLLTAQQQLFQVEKAGSLNVQLGNMLLNSVEHGSVLSVPGKLLKAWRTAGKTKAPASLGGKDFTRVIEQYLTAGFAGVDSLLAKTNTSATVKANAHTALARHLQPTDKQASVQAARNAYSQDPKPFRLKWLLYRLYEAGEVLEAEALLHLLPQDINLSDSEANKLSRLQREAKQQREQAAKSQTNYAKRKADNEFQLASLARDRDEQTQLAEERNRQIQQLQSAKQTLEQNQKNLTEENRLVLEQLFQVQEELERYYIAQQALKQEIVTLKNETNGLAQSKNALEQQAAAFSQQLTEEKAAHAALAQANGKLEARLQELGQQVEQLTRTHGAELATLATQKQKASQAQKELADENELLFAQLNKVQEKLQARTQELNEAANAKAQLEEKLQQDNNRLAEQLSAALLQGEQLGQQLHALTQGKAQLEHDHREQTLQHQAALKLAEQRQQELETLQQARTALEQEKQQLTEQKAHSLKLAEQHKQELETLAAVKARLEKEAATQAQQLQAANKQAEQQQQQITELKQQMAGRSEAEKELGQRQQLMNEEMLRAEAQLDLIKDMLLREPRL